MGVVENEEIVGYLIEAPDHQREILVCLICIDKRKLKNITEEDIVREHNIDRNEEKYFCDRCKKKL